MLGQPVTKAKYGKPWGLQHRPNTMRRIATDKESEDRRSVRGDRTLPFVGIPSFLRTPICTAPDELAANAGFSTSPEGELLMHISVCSSGALDQGERVLRPLRQFGPPVLDEIGPITYLDLQARRGLRFAESLHFYWKSHFLKQISDDAIDVLINHFATVPSPLSTVGLQQYGGAISRVDPSETAFSHRDAQYDFIPASIWTDPKESPSNIQWSHEIWESMKPFSTGGEYVNNQGEEGEDRVKAAYGDNYDRLVALKNKYDPNNFFRLNANVKPTV